MILLSPLRKKSPKLQIEAARRRNTCEWRIMAQMLETVENQGFFQFQVEKVCAINHHPYEWGYTYGAPQAVSPVNRIRRVLDYAVSVMPAGKILMGFSNYAYDWTLPWKQGTAARVLSNAGAQELAASRWAEIRYDETAQAAWFNYTDTGGRSHVVWFEDARSVRARLRLVEEYGLAGISIWTADRVWQPLYALLESMYSVEKII